KLDGSFVRGFQYEERAAAAPNPADEVIVEAMVQLAHRLGLTVTAECVETSAQATRLRRIGCDTGQGWLYSRPVSPDRISALLAGPGVQAGVAGNPWAWAIRASERRRTSPLCALAVIISSSAPVRLCSSSRPARTSSGVPKTTLAF